LCATCGPLPV